MADFTANIIPTSVVIAGMQNVERSVGTMNPYPAITYGTGSAGSSTTTTATALFRGRSGGNYVYSLGSPPGGATDIVIVVENVNA